MARVLQRLPEKAPSKGKAPLRRTEECREIFANLSEYLDERLAPASCEKMRVHIEKCPACVAFIKDLRRVIERCREFPSACDPHTASRLRAMMTQEFLRLMGQGS
jgi:RNA polymerase sigma-70 factor (ECF subfamily)